MINFSANFLTSILQEKIYLTITEEKVHQVLILHKQQLENSSVILNFNLVSFLLPQRKTTPNNVFKIMMTFFKGSKITSLFFSMLMFQCTYLQLKLESPVTNRYLEGARGWGWGECKEKYTYCKKVLNFPSKQLIFINILGWLLFGISINRQLSQ